MIDALEKQADEELQYMKIFYSNLYQDFRDKGGFMAIIDIVTYTARPSHTLSRCKIYLYTLDDQT